MARLLDLVVSKDGSLSLTKLAAATGHFLMAAAFVRLQVLAGEFNDTLWLLYAGFTVAHASYDKTVAVVTDYKLRQKPPADPQQGGQQ